MNVTPPLGSLFTNFVNQEAKKAQQKYLAESGGQPRSVAETGTNVIKDAQIASARDAKADADAMKANAAAIEHFAKLGIAMTSGSFASLYKSEVENATDQNSDGVISLSELDQQVRAGGGTHAQANLLYAAMDENGDGSVSAQEFEDSLPNPFATPEFMQQMKTSIEQFQKQANPNGQIVVEPDDSTPVQVNTGLVLGSLAMELYYGGK